MRAHGSVSIAYFLTMLGAVLSSILGAAVVIGWLVHDVTLIQISPTFVPMQFNTALGFLAAGLGLFVVVKGYGRVGMACGFFLLLVGLLTLAEYLIGIDLGIDQLMMKHYITVETSYPGRMEPNTALCFALAGVALIKFGLAGNVSKDAAIAGLAGTLIFSLSFIALAGYAVGVEAAYGWGKWTRMAVHTAGGFLILGTAISGYAWSQNDSEASHWPRWFPLPVGVGVLTIVLSFWQALRNHEAELVERYGIEGGFHFVHDALLGFGIAFAAALSLVAYLADAARKRERKLEAINRRLEAEIDERTQVEAALRESEDRVGRVMNNAPMGIGIVVDRRIRFANAHMCSLIGYREAELVGQNVQILYPTGAEFQRVGRTKYPEIREQGIGGIETQFQHKNGAVIDVFMRTALLEPGNPSAGFIFSVIDLSEIKRADENRERAEMALRRGEVERIVQRERTGERVKELRCMFDVTESVCKRETIEQVFQDVVALIPPGWQFPEITRARIRLEDQEYVSQPFEETPWRQNANIMIGGETRGTVEVFYLEECPELDEGPFCKEERDLLNGIASALSGAIERKRVEQEKEKLREQFLQAQKMESIGRLAGGVAHDFNNLLTVILSSCSFMAEELRAGDPLLEDLRQIESAGDRAVSLTRQLLAFSRRQVLQTEVLDVSRILKDLDKMLRRLIGEDISLVTEIDSELWKIVADPGQVEQIVMNLVINARDAMPNGGRLTLEASNVELDEEYARSHVSVTPGPHVMLGVSDTGCGMDAATMAHVFDPFFTTKQGSKGTGLGLSTVYGIVKQHGGNIWIYSEPDKGTSLKIYLPRAEGTEIEVSKAVGKVVDLHGSETVLVVEDEAAVLQLAVRVLERKGYRVLKARDGLEGQAVANAHKGPIDLLLTDVVMPNVSGKEMAEKVLVARPDLKVLYMSGYTDNSIVHHGMLDRGTHFLEKPFSVKSLARKVREVLDGD